MNRMFLSFLKSLFLAMLVVSTFSIASEEKKTAKPDLAQGESLFVNGDAGRNIPACASCHGAAGNSTIVQNPKLAGQQESYIAKQLMDFKGTNRNNAVMTPYAKAMTDAEIKNVAAYLAMQTQKSGAAKNKETIDLGKKIFRAGIADKNVPACAACHSANGAGIPTQYPRLAGQHQDYTVTQLTNFRTGARSNSAEMNAIAKRMSDDEIKAVADYIAGLK